MNGKTTINTRHHPWPTPKIRLARYLPLLIITGLAVHLLLPQIASLENSVNVVRSMSLWLVSLAVIAQVCSYLGSGYLLKVIVDVDQHSLSIPRGMLITMAAASIGLVAGGWVGAAAMTYRWIEERENTSEEAALAGVLPFLFNNALLVVVTVIGLVYLLINHHLSRLQVIGYSAFLSLIVSGLLVIVYGVQHRALAARLVLQIAARLMHILKRAYDPAVIQNSIDNIFVSLALLQERGWIQPALGSGMNIVFDMLTLYFLFIAVGHTINPGVLMAGYGLAFLLGKVAFLFPGGVGVIESGMTAIFTNLGIPGSISVVVILGYRLFSFWLPSLLGFAAAGYLQKR
ncbi:MAG: lysylphosphatidylglycerol synthase transmembrane domain-containing protein [Omnitrophica WOR_2 bacterium]